MAGTLTVANSSIVLSVETIFPAPVPLTGYAADDIFSIEQATHIETSMGLDNRLSAGWVPAERVVSISLQGDSDSNRLFEQWNSSQVLLRDALTATLIITIFGINRVYICNKGFLRNFSPMPDARRILQPRRYTMVFESVEGQPA